MIAVNCQSDPVPGGADITVLRHYTSADNNAYCFSCQISNDMYLGFFLEVEHVLEQNKLLVPWEGITAETVLSVYIFIPFIFCYYLLSNNVF